MFWLVRPTVRNAPERFVLAAVAVALPVGVLAATLLYVDSSLRSMTRVALQPVQVEMRALAASLDTDMRQVAGRLRTVRDVQRVDLFGSADVVVSAGNGKTPVAARLFAVDPSYLAHHDWVRASGELGRGALLTSPLARQLARGSTVTVALAHNAAPLHLALPVAGRVELTDARTWFAVPTGAVQGDLAVKPRAIVIDYGTFERSVLPALRRSPDSAAGVTNPGLSDLPPASNEVHIAVDHHAYPADPAAAATWSAGLRRALERADPADVIVADNAAEPLQEAAADATNAKILFVVLGVPGALVAAALGLTAAAALAEANRREDALLRLRGATDRQLARLAVGQGVLSGTTGIGLGLIIAAAGASAAVGHAVWNEIPAARLSQTVVLAGLIGVITTVARLAPMVRAGRRSSILTARRRLESSRAPFWLRARLDVWSVAVGAVILGGNILAGGLHPDPVEGATAALSFYQLLAPLALWGGTVLLAVRGLLAVLARYSRPDRAAPLTSWRATLFRWLGRRPTRTAGAVVLGALAVAFGTQVAAFVATYSHAERTDARAAFGADLRLTPDDPRRPLPPLGSDIAAVSAIRTVPGRAGPDRKNVLAIDADSYPATAVAPRITQGGGIAALVADPSGVLIADEVVRTLGVGVGDTLPVTVFPDEPGASRQLTLHVVGVYRAFPPTDPLSELVITTRTLAGILPAPDFYLARVAPGRDAQAVAARLKVSTVADHVSVTTAGDYLRQEQRGLTAVNLDGLSGVELASAALIAAIGVGLLSAFLVIERRREAAILRTVGADTRHILAAPVLEGSVAVTGSLLIGVPVGLGLAILSGRVLDLFFASPPPLVVVPWTAVLVLGALVAVCSVLAIGLALFALDRPNVASVLRAP